jgi:hypothetical protein
MKAQARTEEGFIYSNGTYTELLPPGWTSAYAAFIHNSGVVVGGGSDGSGTQRGSIYSGGRYTELLPLGWTSAYAAFINNSGMVVGDSMSMGDTGPIIKAFVAYPPSPEQQIDDIIDFIDSALTTGTATGNCGKVQWKSVEKMLTKAAHRIEDGKIKKACDKLDNAYDRVSKRLKSKKACVAQLAAEVQDQILDVMQDLGCKEQGRRH